MATPYSILAWRIPRTDEPGRLQSMAAKRVLNTFTHIHTVSHKSVFLPLSVRQTHTHTHTLTLSFLEQSPSPTPGLWGSGRLLTLAWRGSWLSPSPATRDGQGAMRPRGLSDMLLGPDVPSGLLGGCGCHLVSKTHR